MGVNVLATLLIVVIILAFIILSDFRRILPFLTYSGKTNRVGEGKITPNQN